MQRSSGREDEAKQVGSALAVTAILAIWFPVVAVCQQLVARAVRRRRTGEVAPPVPPVDVPNEPAGMDRPLWLHKQAPPKPTAEQLERTDRIRLTEERVLQVTGSSVERTLQAEDLSPGTDWVATPSARAVERLSAFLESGLWYPWPVLDPRTARAFADELLVLIGEEVELHEPPESANAFGKGGFHRRGIVLIGARQIAVLWIEDHHIDR